ncbi:MAG: TonB family protein [Steroidobacteraceae bacterium]
MATIHQLFNDNQSSDAGDGSPPSQGQQHAAAPLLSLSNNANLLDIVRRAAPRGSKVVDANNMDTMLSSVRSLRPGILFIDTDCCTDIAHTAIQLLQDLPELIVVVAGNGDESSSLMKLAAAGHIYRFMLKPLAHNQTKLTLEAALNQHNELLASAERHANASFTAQPESPRKNYLPTYIGLSLALIGIVGAAFYGLSRMGNSEPDAAVSTNSNSTANNTASKELDIADAALVAGKLLEPPGESALDLYRSALAIDAGNIRAQAGIENVANKLLEQAEVALTAEQLETTVRVLEQARDISPNNSRLKFLDGQLARERERLKLAQGQDVNQKVRALLADAQDSMDAGRLISPANSNARASILAARRIDATDPSVAQSQRSLSNLLVEAARRAADQNQTEQAQTYLSAARQLGSAGADLSATERIINAASSRAASSAASEAQLAAAQQAAIVAQAERDAAVAAAAAAKKAATAARSASTASALPPVALKRIKTVAPVFPAEAKNRGTSGWVDVSFIVDERGQVTEPNVVDSDPKNVFDAAAITAVEQWRFEPPVRNGQPISQPTRVKLRFDIDN